jgi:CelD/BcsL family acetyltransferase involved in cellulose biosynthesis
MNFASVPVDDIIQRPEMTEGTKVIREIKEFAAIGSAWNEFAADCANPLLNHAWFQAAAQTFCPPDRLCAITVWSGPALKAIAPCAILKRGGLERIEILGSVVLGEPSAFLHCSKDSLQILMETILGMQMPVVLRRLSTTSMEAEFINCLIREGKFFAFETFSGSPWIPLEGGWEGFQKRFSAKRRATFRRSWKLAEEMGRVEIEIVKPDASNLHDYMSELMRVETANWKGREGTSLGASSQLKTFFSLYSELVVRLGVLRMAFLRINGKAVAAMLAIEQYDKFWVLKIGYDETASRCSPGILLIHQTVQYAFEHQLQTYEFLGSDEPWLHIWTDNVRPYVTLRLYRHSAKAILNLGVDGSSLLLHRAFGIPGAV